MLRKVVAVLAAGLVCLAFFSASAILSETPAHSSAALNPAVRQGPAGLPGILEDCAHYCDRLQGSILDFVCTEGITETIRGIVTTKSVSANGSAFGAKYFTGQPVFGGAAERFKFVYDYQLVRDRSGTITETRTLLEANGRRVEEKNAPLFTHAFHYTYIIMGPVDLLGRNEQKRFDYEYVRKTSLQRERIAIIKATPKSGSAGDILFGKIWVRKSDAAILRIEWEPESMGNYERIEELARDAGLKPRLSFAAEYAFEKNGIRFPSLYTIEEAYARNMRRPLVRSETEVTFSDYKFFTVETGVEIR
jgi:hypothetical protein